LAAARRGGVNRWGNRPEDRAGSEHRINREKKAEATCEGEERADGFQRRLQDPQGLDLACVADFRLSIHGRIGSGERAAQPAGSRITPELKPGHAVTRGLFRSSRPVRPCPELRAKG